MRRSAVIVLCLLVVTATIVTATSHGEPGDPDEPPENGSDDDAEEDEEQTETEREVTVEQHGDRVNIESKHEVERGETEQEDKFKLEFSVEEDPRIKLSTESETETATEEVENESEYKVRFRSLAEFAASDTVQEDGDPVSTYDLETATFDDITYNTRTVDGNTVHVIEATTTDGVFAIRLHAVGDITNIDGEQVEPTEVKIDLEMHDYNFTAENSSLALRTETESETEHEVEQNDTEETVVRSTDGSGNGVYFSWKNTAQVDGEQTPVRSTNIEADDNEEEFYLVYDQGSSIIHDPKIGIDTTASASSGGFLNWLLSFLQGLF